MKQIKQLLVIGALSLTSTQADEPRHRHGHGGGDWQHHATPVHQHGHHHSSGNIWANAVLPSIISAVLAPRPVVVYNTPVFNTYSPAPPVYYGNQSQAIVTYGAPVYAVPPVFQNPYYTVAPTMVYDPCVMPMVVQSPYGGYQWQYRQHGIVNGAW